jgi:hypothetical protein
MIYSYNLSEDGKIENIKYESDCNAIDSNDIAIELLKKEFYKTYSSQLKLSHFDEENGLYKLWFYHKFSADLCCYGRITSSGAKISSKKEDL